MLALATAFAFLCGASCASSKDPVPGASGGSSGSQGYAGEPSLACETVAPRSCPDPPPSYASDVRPIIEDLCLGCHFGEEDGPWTLDGYEHLANWHDLLRGVMLNCEMPPVDAGIAMSTEERQVLLQWLRCGYPNN